MSMTAVISRFAQRRLGQAVILALLSALALAIRIPYLYSIPRYGEANENFLAIGILEGKYPLINQNPHIGALSPYIIAGFLAVLGKHWWVSRLVPLLAGAATVTLTYLLGRLTMGVWAAAAAGLMMATSWYHVIFTSHYAWSNSLTPFFITAFLLVFSRALAPPPNGKHALNFLAAGLLYGLALQSHPESAIFAPAILAAFIMSERHLLRWLAKPSAWLFGAAAALGYANMLYYNVAHKFASVSFGMSYPKYALVERYSVSAVAANYMKAILHLPRMMFGFYDEAAFGGLAGQLPFVVLLWALIIAGLAAAVRRREWPLPLAFCSGMLLIPAINKSYTTELGRYLVPLFPFAYLLSVNGLTSIWPGAGGRLANARRAAAAVAGLALIALPLPLIHAYYQQTVERSETSDVYFEFKELVDDLGQPRPFIYIDDSIQWSHAFLQFLKEDGNICLLLAWDKPGPLPFDDVAFQQEVAGLRNRAPGRKVLAAVAPWNREAFLARVPVTRLAGSLGVPGPDSWQDLFNLYELANPETGGTWLNPELLFAQTRASRQLPLRESLLAAGEWAGSGTPAFSPALCAGTADVAHVLWDAGNERGVGHGTVTPYRTDVQYLRLQRPEGLAGLLPVAAPDGRWFALQLTAAENEYRLSFLAPDSGQKALQPSAEPYLPFTATGKATDWTVRRLDNGALRCALLTGQTVALITWPPKGGDATAAELFLSADASVEQGLRLALSSDGQPVLWRAGQTSVAAWRDGLWRVIQLGGGPAALHAAQAGSDGSIYALTSRDSGQLQIDELASGNGYGLISSRERAFEAKPLSAKQRYHFFLAEDGRPRLVAQSPGEFVSVFSLRAPLPNPVLRLELAALPSADNCGVIGIAAVIPPLTGLGETALALALKTPAGDVLFPPAWTAEPQLPRVNLSELAGGGPLTVVRLDPQRLPAGLYTITLLPVVPGTACPAGQGATLNIELSGCNQRFVDAAGISAILTDALTAPGN